MVKRVKQDQELPNKKEQVEKKKKWEQNSKGWEVCLIRKMKALMTKWGRSCLSLRIRKWHGSNKVPEQLIKLLTTRPNPRHNRLYHQFILNLDLLSLIMIDISGYIHMLIDRSRNRWEKNQGGWLMKSVFRKIIHLEDLWQKPLQHKPRWDSTS